MNGLYRIILLVLIGFFVASNLFADGDNTADKDAFDPSVPAYHHVADANVYSIGPWSFPLPCILYSPDKGWDVFSSGRFGIYGHHGDGMKVVNGYVLNGGAVMRIPDEYNFQEGVVQLIDTHQAEALVEEKEHFFHSGTDDDGKHYSYFNYKGEKIKLHKKSTADFGLFGGGITSFYDFSLTKNVVSMLLMAFLLMWAFIGIARKYNRTQGQAPSGLQSFMEPIFVFIQDEVAKPFLGKHWERFLPLLMCLFFFILALNLWGQIPFFGGANVTGNLAVTAVLAIIVFIVTNVNGNKHYWEHVLWMPGIPPVLKIFIITPVEILGLFIKPITLMLRLFANITAGHMVIVIFVGLIFLFGGTTGSNPGTSLATAVGSTLLTVFMMSIELLVAFIQAFVFTILTASYIGAATEEAHH